MPDKFTFDAVNHIVRNEADLWVPTSTQVMELMHLSPDFDKFVARGIIERDALDRRSAIGSEVHRLTDLYDRFGDLDPTWQDADTGGYVESYIGLLRLTNAEIIQSSVRMCETVDGLQWSGEMDKWVRVNGREGIWDLKTGTTASDSWGCQLASYECLKYRSRRIGRINRCVAHLRKDGAPGRLIEYGDTSRLDGMHYADAFFAALHLTHAAIRRGYVSEKDFACIS